MNAPQGIPGTKKNKGALSNLTTALMMSSMVCGSVSFVLSVLDMLGTNLLTPIMVLAVFFGCFAAFLVLQFSTIFK